MTNKQIAQLTLADLSVEILSQREEMSHYHTRSPAAEAYLSQLEEQVKRKQRTTR